jgi:DNA repair protein RAD51
LLAPARQVLLNIKGISDVKVEKFKEAARKIVPMGFKSAFEALQTPKSYITTGSKELDDILGGGVEIGSVTEFFGEFRTGESCAFSEVASASAACV